MAVEPPESFGWPLKPLAIKAIVLGLLFATAILLTFVVEFAVRGALGTDPTAAATVGFVAVFSVLFVVAALLAYREKRAGYLLAGILALAFLLLFGTSVPFVMMNPAEFGLFFRTFAAVALLVLVLVFGFGAFARSARLRETRWLARWDSAGGVLTLLVLGAIIGAGLEGLAAGAAIERIVEASERPAGAIEMVEGAYNHFGGEDTYVPATFTVAANTTVTWYNGDILTHTVTSDDLVGGVPRFESGEIPPGTTWSYTFTAAGTYRYHCAPHPNMVGTIIVT